MTWWMFYLIASGLIVLVAALVVFPLVLNRNAQAKDALTNTQIVRQRLSELEREMSEGLISEQDMRQASDELKMALVDEYQERNTAHSRALAPVLLGAAFAVAAGVAVYYQVNQLSLVERAEQAKQSLPRLTEHLANGGGDSFTQKDISDLSLAIRERLRHAPDDPQGWMLLGRLWITMGQQQQAVQALEKAVALQPNDPSLRMSYAQALMGTGEEERLRHAQRILAGLLNENPANDNLALLMTVASAQLGDLEETEQYFAQIKDRLPADGEMRQGIEARIAEMRGEPVISTGQTGFSIEVSVAEELQSKLPQSGFLIVFAQDAQSDNRMPAAVVKMPLNSLPVTVNLTTDNAMLPNYNLNSIKEARLVARISLDENVATQAGEFEGELNVPVVSGTSVAQSIVISKEL